MSDLHHEADGSHNMKLSSTKALVSTNDENSSKLSNLSNTSYNKTNNKIDMGYSAPRKHPNSVKSNKISHNDSFLSHLHHKKDSRLNFGNNTPKNSEVELKIVRSSELRKPLKHSSSTKTTNDEHHHKKISANDLRYKSTKRDIQSQIQIPNIKPHNYEKDMSEKIYSEYSALPTDENGETIENSPELIKFRTHYSLNPAPSANFDFDSIQPVHYNGQNTSIHTNFKNANHVGKTYLGRMTLYYATSTENAEEILKSKTFTQKVFGSSGTAINFADNKQTAIYKAAILDTDLANSLIVANVDMGTALVVEGPSIKFNSDQVKQFQCDSVLHRNDQNSDWEYAVYEPSKIQLITGYIFR